jgi:hypothetical protein
MLLALYPGLCAAAETGSANSDEPPMVVLQPSAEMTFTIRGDGDEGGAPELYSLERMYSQYTSDTVHDASTGLVWQQHDDDEMRTWKDAKTYCQALSINGLTHWRLPERGELISLIDFDRVRPPIDTDFFPNTKLFNYWAAAEYTGTTEHAWSVLFAEGNVYCFRKILQSYTRCVTSVDA